MNPRKTYRNQDGQAIVLMVLALLVLLGMAALVLDAGAWFRTDRRLQQTADAAALAGVQELPKNPTLAKAVALNYAIKNGGDVALGDIEVTETFNPNDTIKVTAQKDEAGFFSKVLGVDETHISASAKARVDSPAQARYVAPMVVYCDHDLIQNCDGNNDFIKFGVPTTLQYDKFGAPGAFGMLNLGKKGGDDDTSGTPGTSEQAEWIRRGFDKYLGYNTWFKSNPGAKFSSQEIQSALESRSCLSPSCPPLLFPVYSELKGQGEGAQYYVIGWIGFKLTGFKVAGNNAELTGYFTEFIAKGLLSSSGSGSPPTFGVKSIQLIE
jgi:Flp pilus assembly protein TadG